MDNWHKYKHTVNPKVAVGVRWGWGGVGFGVDVALMKGGGGGDGAEVLLGERWCGLRVGVGGGAGVVGGH